jgi:hypothetical protein
VLPDRFEKIPAQAELGRGTLESRFQVRAGCRAWPLPTLDEFVERAVSMLHEQEVWLAQNRSEIARKIEEGYAAAERGEPLDPTRYAPSSTN